MRSSAIRLLIIIYLGIVALSCSDRTTNSVNSSSKGADKSQVAGSPPSTSTSAVGNTNPPSPALGPPASNEVAEAIKELEVKVLQEPKNPLNYFSLAMLYEKDGNTTAEIEYLKKAIGADPQNPVTHGKLAVAFNKIGEPRRQSDEQATAERLLKELPDVQGTKVVPRNAISGRDYYDQFGNVYSLGRLRASPQSTSDSR